MSSDTDRTRVLNDELRQHLLGGGAVTTTGIAALGDEAISRLVQAVAEFDDFCDGNDPYHEHDFGALDFEGHRVMFKIDYYAQGMLAASSNPADPLITERVMTLMLAEEY